MTRRAVIALTVLLGAAAAAGCTSQPEPLVESDPDFCTQLIAGVADYTDFATAVIDGTEVTAPVRDVAASYVAALRASAPDDAEITTALATFTTPYEVDRGAQGQEDDAPEPIDADTLTAATSTLLTACATQ
ncbi:hypothetical protein [Cellulomonas soli]